MPALDHEFNDFGSTAAAPEDYDTLQQQFTGVTGTALC